MDEFQDQATLLTGDDLGLHGEAEVEKGDIIAALQGVCEVFIDFFMHESLTFQVPTFHKRIWSLMSSTVLQRIALAVPRGHAKTTLAKLVVVWYFLFSPLKFIVYVSNTADLAIKCCSDIMEFFLCSNFIKLFGPVYFETEKWGEGEFEFIVNTPFHGQKRCILKARGANQQVRGLNIHNLRPEAAVVDDLEETEDFENEAVYKKTLKWFFGTFMKAIDRRVGKIIYIGNLTDKNCLLFKLIQSKYWTSMRLGAILKDGSSLWPEMWPVQALLEDYQHYTQMGLQSVWFAEMMNLIIAGENALIKSEEIYYRPPAMVEVARAGFITIDPATGTGGDDTAVVAHLLVEDESGNLIPQVVDYRIGQLGELATVDAAIELCNLWGLAVVGIESIAYQRALYTVFMLIFSQRGIQGIDVVKLYPGNASKLSRLRGWAAACKDRAYALTEGDFHATNQLLGFDVTKDNNEDDLIDAIAEGLQMIEGHWGLIMSKKLGVLVQQTPVRAAMLC